MKLLSKKYRFLTFCVPLLLLLIMGCSEYNKILKGSDRKIFETQKIKLDVLKSEKIIGLN